MIALAALPLAYSGFALLALSMDRHARQAMYRTKRAFRPVGWGLLALSLLAVPLAPNPRFALVEWIGLLGAAAGLVVLTLHHRAHRLPPFAIAAAMLGAGGLARLAAT